MAQAQPPSRGLCVLTTVRSQIFIKSSAGSERFEADAAESVEDLKLKLCERTGLKGPEITYNGRVLEDVCTLGDYDVAEEATLEAFVPMLGGKQHGSLARAGKVRGQTPKVEKQDKKKKVTGRAKRRIQYNRRFVNAVCLMIAIGGLGQGGGACVCVCREGRGCVGVEYSWRSLLSKGRNLYVCTCACASMWLSVHPPHRQECILWVQCSWPFARHAVSHSVFVFILSSILQLARRVCAWSSWGGCISTRAGFSLLSVCC